MTCIESTNNGTIIPMISVFPQRKPGGKDVIRIWNSQLIAYAGYPCPQDPKVFIGDRGNVTFTQFCQSLGWKGKGGKLDTVQDFLIKLGMQTTFADIGNMHFFTKSCHP